MGKAGEKQKRRPKIKDKNQSERFKEAARELGADQEAEAMERIVKEMAVPTEKYVNSEMFVYDEEGVHGPFSCEVTIRPGSIEVAYDNDDNEGRVYRGEEMGLGHFKMRASNGNGEGNLHRFAKGLRLDGWWHESTYEGMWRIKLR